MTDLQSIYFMIINNNIINYILFFLLSMIPASLISGPFLPDLFASLMGLMFIILNFNKIINLKSYLNNFTIIFIIFYSLIILSTIFSYDPMVSLEYSLFYFRFLFFALCISFLLSKNLSLLKYLILIFSLTFFVVYIDTIIQYFNGKNLTGFPIDDHGGLNSFFGTNEDGILGSYIVRLSPILCSIIAFQYNSKLSHYYILFIMLLSSVIPLFSQERAAFFLSFIPFFMYIFCTDTFSRKQKIISILVFFIIFVIVFSLNSAVFVRYFNSIRDQIFNNNNFFIFSERHQAHYTSAIKMFLEEPMLGVGPKIFRYYCSDLRFYIEYACSTHPHNTYIQLLAETGILVFSVISSLFIYLISLTYKQFMAITFKKSSKYKSHFILIISAMLVTLWPFTPTGSFFNNWLSVIYFLPVGFYLFYIKDNNHLQTK